MPIHLRAEPGDYAPNVLCPGDPVRAQYIAETFFDAGFRQVNGERGMLGFTGTFEGRPISVQSTGMGCPSAGIVFEELVMLGAQRLVRVGTCGGLQAGVAMGDTVIAITASADDTAPLRYAQMEGFAPSATFTLAETAATLSRDAGSGDGARRLDRHLRRCSTTPTTARSPDGTGSVISASRWRRRCCTRSPR